MINLLNPKELKQIRAARINVRLRRYSIATLLTLVAITGAYFVSYTIADDRKTKADADNTSSQQQLTAFSTVIHDAQAYQSNLLIAKKILGSEITFSTFMVDVSKILPPNTILDNLTLSTKATQGSTQKPGSTQIKARAKGYNDVLTLKTKLEESSLFSNVKITSTTAPSTFTGKSGIEITYPYEVTYDVVINELGGLSK